MTTTPTRTATLAALLALALAALAGTATPAAAQAITPPAGEQLARHSLYFELGGNGLLYSLNYDHRFRENASARMGMMWIHATADPEEVGLLLLPATLNYLAGRGSHRLELGGGPLLAYANGTVEDDEVGGLQDVSGFAVAATGTLGYRYQPLRGGFNFRVGFTPLLSTDGVSPWFGLSLGYGF